MRSRSIGVNKGRRCGLAILAASVLLLAAGWRAGPDVEDRFRLYLAGRDVEAGRLDEAEARLDLLIAEHPARTRPRFLRAQVARKRGQITEAEETLQRAIELGLPVEQARREHEKILGHGWDTD